MGLSFESSNFGNFLFEFLILIMLISKILENNHILISKILTTCEIIYFQEKKQINVAVQKILENKLVY